MKSKRILLIDDNPGDARLTKEVIKETEMSNQIEVDVISDSEDAELFLLQKPPFENFKKPDIIILDLNLPKKNGIEILIMLKASEYTKKIPVIIMTTSDADYDLQNAYENLANAYIVKPADFDTLVRVMKCVTTFWFETVLLPK